MDSDAPTPHESGATLGPLLHAAAFVSGFVTMALEMLIGRTFIPFFGGTVYTWGALISVFLTGMTLGYVAGGKAADRRPDARGVGRLFLLATAFTLLVPLLGEHAINLILDRVADVRLAALSAAFALAFLPAMFFAAVCPYCMRLLLDSKDRAGTVSGRLSGLAAAGSILGTLGTTFFFIPSLGTRAIYWILAMVSLLMAILLLFSGTRRAQRGTMEQTSRLVPAAILACIGVMLVPDNGVAQPSSLSNAPDGLIERVDSEYNTIFVEKHGTQIALTFGYRGNRFIESLFDLSKPADLIAPYTRFMTVAIAYPPQPPRRVALIGMGGGRTIGYLVSTLSDVVADAVELDTEVIRMAAKYFGTGPTDRLRIHGIDGRIFLSQSKEKYDLILLDAYRGSFIPFHLTTQEFYRLVKSRLGDGGVVAQNVDPSTLYFVNAIATMHSVFEQIDAYDAGGNVVLIGYGGPKLSDADLALKAGAAQDRFRPRHDLRELIKARKGVNVFAKAKILTDDFAPVEMLNTVKRHNEKRM